MQDTTAIIQGQDTRHVIGRVGSGNMKLTELDSKLDTDTKLNFDVVDDLHVFMRNDPMFYRKCYYPTMCSISDNVSEMHGKNLAKVLMPMIDKAAEGYCKRFNLGRSSNDVISLEDRKSIARKIASEEMPRIREGEYK